MLTRQAPQSISPFFIEKRVAGGRRHQRRQRDAGRLPRLRHAGRDHRAGHRRAHRLRAAAPLPAAARGHRACRSSSASFRTGRRATCSTRPDRSDAASGYLLVPAVLVRLLLPVAARVRAPPAAARAQRARAAASSPGSWSRSPSSRSTWSAARAGSSRAPTSSCRAGSPLGLLIGAGHRAGRDGARPSVPDAPTPRTSTLPVLGLAAPAVRGPLRRRRLRGRGRLDPAAADRAGAPVAARPAPAAAARRRRRATPDGRSSSRWRSACWPAPACGWCCVRGPSRC